MWPAPYMLIPPPWPTGDEKIDALRMAEYRKQKADNARMSRNIGIGVFTFFGLAVGGLFFLVDSTKSTPAVPLFNAGDTVKMKLDGRAGMVLSTWCGSRPICEYKVRFSAASLNTDVHLLAPDGAVVSGAYSDVWVREFELEGSK